MIHCDRYRDLLELLRDGALPGAPHNGTPSAEEVHSHGRTCPECRTWESEMDVLVAPLRHLPPGPYLPGNGPSSNGPRHGGWTGMLLLLLLLAGGLPLLASTLRPDPASAPREGRSSRREHSRDQAFLSTPAGTAEEGTPPPPVLSSDSSPDVPPDPLVLEDPEPAGLSGRLVDSVGGHPLAGIGVSVGNVSTVTDGRGLFLLEGLEALRRATLTVSPIEGPAVTLSLPALAPGRVNDLDDITAGAAVPFRILVRDLLDAPVAGAEVRIFRPAVMLGPPIEADDDIEPYTPCARMTTTTDGSVRIPDLPAGRYVVTASFPGFAPSCPRWATVRPGGEAVAAVCTLLPPAHMTGRVIDFMTGRPLPGAVVVVRDHEFALHRYIPAWRGVADEEGRWSMESLPARTLSLEARRAPFSISDITEVDAVHDTWADVPILGDSTLYFLVEDADTGRPLGNLPMVVGGYRDGRTVQQVMRTDASGRLAVHSGKAAFWVLPDPLGAWYPERPAMSRQRRRPTSPQRPLRVRVRRHEPVTATVVGDDRTPRPGALVAVVPAPGHRFPVIFQPLAWHVRAGDDGTVRLPGGLCGEHWRVVAREDAELPVAARDDLVAIPPVDPGADSAITLSLSTAPGGETPPLRPATAVLVEGRLGPVTPSTDPLLRLYVRHDRSIAMFDPRGFNDLVRVRPDGRFTLLADDFSHVPDHKGVLHPILFQCRGRVTAPLDAPPVHANGEDPVVVELVNEGGRTVTGVVLDSAGAPMADLPVRVAVLDPAAGILSGIYPAPPVTHTGDDGSFVVNGLPGATVALRFGRALHPGIRRRDVGPDESHVVVRWDGGDEGGGVTVSVRDAGGAAVENASVHLRGLTTRSTVRHGRTGADGFLTVLFPADEPFVVTVSGGARGAAPRLATVDSPPREAGTARVQVIVRSAGPLRGRVTRADGTVEAGATVTLHAGGETVASVVTTDDGTFFLEDRGPSPRTLHVSPAAGFPFLRPVADEEDDLLIVLPALPPDDAPPILRLRVRLEDDRRPDGGTVRVHGGEDHAIPGGPITASLVGGDADIPLPLAMPVALEVDVDGGPTRMVDGLSPRSEPHVLRLDRPAVGGLSGRVLGVDGRPVEGAEVVALRGDAVGEEGVLRRHDLEACVRASGAPFVDLSEWRRAKSGADGRFHLGNPPGRWIVSVIATSGSRVSARATSWERGSGGDLALETVEAPPLRFQVVEGDEPAEGVIIRDVRWTLDGEPLTFRVRPAGESGGVFRWPAVPAVKVIVTAATPSTVKTWTLPADRGDGVLLLDLDDTGGDVRAGVR